MPKCKGCGQEIIWAKTASGKATPLDAKKKTFYYRSKKIEGGWGRFSAGHEPHFYTCPVADTFKKKKPVDHAGRSKGERIAYLQGQAARLKETVFEAHLQEAKQVQIDALNDRVAEILKSTS